MTSFALVAFIFIAVFAVLFLVDLALVIYVIWLVNKTTKRVDALEAELKNLRGTPPIP